MNDCIGLLSSDDGIFDIPNYGAGKPSSDHLLKVPQICIYHRMLFWAIQRTFSVLIFPQRNGIVRCCSGLQDCDIYRASYYCYVQPTFSQYCIVQCILIRIPPAPANYTTMQTEGMDPTEHIFAKISPLNADLSGLHPSISGHREPTKFPASKDQRKCHQNGNFQ